MRIGVDSSILVATMHANHPLHTLSVQWFTSQLSAAELWVAHHSLLECYAVLTRLPLPLRVSGSEACRLLEATVRPHVKLAAYNAESIWDLLYDLADRQIAGGRAYDAFIADALRRCGVTALATYNRRHFENVSSGLTIIDPAAPDAR